MMSRKLHDDVINLHNVRHLPHVTQCKPRRSRDDVITSRDIRQLRHVMW